MCMIICTHALLIEVGVVVLFNQIHFLKYVVRHMIIFNCKLSQSLRLHTCPVVHIYFVLRKITWPELLS